MHTPLSIKTIVLAALISFILLIGIGFLFLKDYNVSIQKKIPEGVACTSEAKLCPDGSAVGRVPPSCEFAPCPGGNDPIDDGGNTIGTSTVSSAPVLPGQSAMAKIPDLPLGKLQEPSPSLSVKYVVEHRTALNEKRISVTGIIVRNALEEQTCPPDRMCALMYMPPQIAIADTASERNVNYHVTVMMPEEARKQADMYPVGSEVALSAIVDGSLEGIMLRVDAVNETAALKTSLCKNVESSNELTFLQSYCMGDKCYGERTKKTCESVDVVTVTDGKLDSSSGQDSIGDCIWIESESSLNQCKVKYR